MHPTNPKVTAKVRIVSSMQGPITRCVPWVIWLYNSRLNKLNRKSGVDSPLQVVGSKPHLLKCRQCRQCRVSKPIRDFEFPRNLMTKMCRKCRNADFLRRYKVSIEVVEHCLLRQDSSCGICGDVFKKVPHVDHCHKTGKFRGLLCSSCNHCLSAADRVGIIWLSVAKMYLLRE